MNKIRTLTQLQEAMSREFAWRKKELHGVKSLVDANQWTHNRDLYVRAAVTLLYAHWEGFIKQIGGMYLEFVARSKLINNNLQDNFLALSIGKIVREAANSRKIQPCLDLVEFFRTKTGNRSEIYWKAGINTKSNLNSEVLRDVITSLGLNYASFETKEKLLDEQLLANRNRIAHGHHSLVSVDEYIDLHGEILGMMQDFYDQVENSSVTLAFRRVPPVGVPIALQP
jgi:hypothetical protein